MSSTATIQYLQLDTVYDPVFDATACLSDLDAVTQAIGTRLRLFLGEWWENLKLGLPVFQQILGQLGSSQGLAAMALAVQQNIEGAPFVVNVLNVSIAFTDGRLSIQYTAQTQFGTVTGALAAPGLDAAGLEIQ